MRNFTVKSSQREQLLDISHDVQRLVDESNVKEGICLIFVPHTTAAITINEGADSSVAVDLLDKLSDLIPRNQDYKHLEGNADAHIKATLVGSSLALPISNGKLTLGTWQRVFFCEFDGPRVRTVLVQILPASTT
ncbi:secondary thiamine-phosphate synthase enzyme YjbQ [Pseudothermotoga sp. U03pept]|uniref:secondary thiamine-phosphate synthase enzyme YjbQ n=1 Tax=Pseudothermotoga sp. U03pept TaxID=3447012 RepID=UPI003F0A6DC6